ncbi:transferrin-binding protein-like solute binding protein, partial [Psychrobacter sp. 1U2]|uniref:transferrin-binding protein-like solute binding protein n=1 Tax=Psychrobacter sp. 1U2 TaxID=3453577 RepID=UPI003F45AC70
TDLDNDFKSYTGSAEIPTALGNLPLNYTSVYKDFGDNMRIGHINGGATLGESQLPVDGVTVTGNATKAENVPTDGTAEYTGDATYRELGLDNNIEYGSSAFTADFVAKKVAGELNFANAGDINLTADIDGNKFSGAAADNDGYNTEGGFYGGDAEYIGGIYEGNGAQGTYGAEKNQAPEPEPEP